MNERVAEADEQRLSQTFEGKAMADIERTDSGIPRDMILQQVASAEEAREIAKSANIVKLDQPDDEADAADPDTGTSAPEGQEEIAVVVAKSPEEMEQARQKFNIPRHPDDEDEEASRKSKSIIFSDDQPEEGFIGKEELQEELSKDQQDNQTAGLEADGANLAGLAGLGAAAGTAGLLGAGGPSGGFNAASGAGGGLGAGGGEGGASSFRFQLHWLGMVRHSRAHHGTVLWDQDKKFGPMARQLDKVIGNVLDEMADGKRDTGVVYSNIGWRNSRNSVSSNITWVLNDRVRYLLNHPEAASKSFSLSPGSPTLSKLNQISFTDDPMEADRMRQAFRASRTAAPAPATPGATP